MTKDLYPKQAYDYLISGEAVLIDVREPDEFASRHIAYAMSLPLSTLDENFKSLDIPSDKKIIFQCFKGSRGEKACALVGQNSDCANEIYNIEGGITAWEKAGLPIVSAGEKSGISIFRQVQMTVGALIALFITVGLIGFSAAFYLAGLMALALFTAGLTGWCGLAMLLSKMPWNKKS